MEITILSIIGFAMMYSWVHFAIIQYNKAYNDRSTYEKIVTWFAVVTISLYIIGTL